MQGADALERALQAQQSLLERLDALLQLELDALVGGDAGLLPSLADEKTALCVQLEQCEQARLLACGGMTDARSEQVRELTQRVAQANQRNGAVVATLMRNAQGALAILRGIPLTDGGSVYGPRGQAATASSATKPLASA